jgi:rubrerythrin
MATEGKAQRRQIYGGYKGKDNPSERDRIMHFLDEYRCSEGFVAEYLSQWTALSTHDSLKGGLPMIREREAAHSRLLEARLRALGGVPQATIPTERREQSLALYASAEKTDVEKLRSLAILFQDPDDFLQPLTDLIAQIQEDQQSKELLRTILDDERASINWLVETYKTLSATEGAR